MKEPKKYIIRALKEYNLYNILKEDNKINILLNNIFVTRTIEYLKRYFSYDLNYYKYTYLFDNIFNNNIVNILPQKYIIIKDVKNINKFVSYLNECGIIWLNGEIITPNDSPFKTHDLNVYFVIENGMLSYTHSLSWIEQNVRNNSIMLNENKFYLYWDSLERKFINNFKLFTHVNFKHYKQ